MNATLQRYGLEHVTSYRASIGAPVTSGPGPDGMRIFFPATGGELSGPRLTGTVVASGGDWVTVRPDGLQLLDVRGMARTDDGAVINSAYTGVCDLGPDGLERMLAGKLPATSPLRGAGRFTTNDPRYAWLDRAQLLLIGEADRVRSEVRFDVYVVA